MHGLEHSAFLADVRARHETESANQPGAQIRNNIAIEIFTKQDVELFGPHDELHRGVVDDDIVSLNLRIFFGDFVKALEKKTVRQFHDVCFMHTRNSLALFAARKIERKTRDARRGFLSNDLQAFDDAGNDHMLESRIKTLGVFAHDDQIEIRIATGNVWQRANRTQVRVKIQSLAQTDVDRPETLADRCGDRPLECDFVPLDRLEQFVGQRVAEFLQRQSARVMRLPFDLDAGSFDHAHDRGGDFRTDAIAGNQCDTMHKKSVSRRQ